MRITIVVTNELKDRAQQLSVELSDNQLSMISSFLKELSVYNEHTNLVGNADPVVVVRDHVLDSLSLVQLINQMRPAGRDSISLVDIGSGAGFPGIILSIVVPDLAVLLTDSVGKKTRFLAETAKILGLDDRVRVENARAEDLSRTKEYRERFDFATARAVGKLELVAELALPFIRNGGFLLAQKSRNQLPDELAQGELAIQEIGGQIVETRLLDKEVLQKDFVVVCVKKTKQTPRQYPRATSELKRPIN